MTGRVRLSSQPGKPSSLLTRPRKPWGWIVWASGSVLVLLIGARLLLQRQEQASALPGQHPVLSQDEAQYRRICLIEFEISRISPGVSAPQTLFELLGLDAYAAPFHPMEESALRNGRNVKAAENALLATWYKSFVASAGHQKGSSSSEVAQEPSPSSSEARDREYHVLRSLAFTALTDIDLRAVYMARFIRPKDADPATNGAWLDRRMDLPRECGRFWLGT